MEDTTPAQASEAKLHDAAEGMQDAAPVLPALDAVTQVSHARAARIMERCGYEITGYTLSHKGGTRKAIVDGSDVRWFPDATDFARMMQWMEPVGPGTPPDTAIGDPLLDNDGLAARAPAPVAPAVQRPLLSAPPSLPMVNTVEEALGVLAAELGCVRNDTVPHNAGWFVPGRPTAFTSALDAIKALVVSLKAGGTVYAAAARPVTDARGPAREATAGEAAHHEQAALF
ncbi:hypothetical protein [Paraburkholderia oxyphila]|uniref:hypothetical protein n=1 Tax=Paraburkholderia oxyphila TaxID=614212 RepID=UPI00048130AB|nr:hypothetical protein [Paraburkholderia oxyphila]